MEIYIRETYMLRKLHSPGLSGLKVLDSRLKVCESKTHIGNGCFEAILFTASVFGRRRHPKIVGLVT